MKNSTAPATSGVERAFAHATEVSLTWGLETRILVDAQDAYRVVLAGMRQAPGERLVAAISADGETLVYGIRPAA